MPLATDSGGVAKPARVVPATVLEVRDLHVEFRTKVGVIHAVNGASYTVREGEALAVVGESGSGKSVTAQVAMGLQDTAVARVTGGEILYRGDNLLRLGEANRRRLRGTKLALVPQDSMAALDPLVPVGRQIGEMFTVHRGESRREALRQAVDLMELVGIPSAARRAGDFPHQFSGGMRQRLVIAVAVALSPELLIADEATSALDVTTQLQVTTMLSRLRKELGMSLVFITHDLLAVRDIADWVAVMYAGRVVESGPADRVFSSPAHPYTEALLLSTPRIDGSVAQLRPIGGRPPGLASLAEGCAFAPRCAYRRDICSSEQPPALHLEDGRRSACLFAPNYRDGVGGAA